MTTSLLPALRQWLKAELVTPVIGAETVRLGISNIPNHKRGSKDLSRIQFLQVVLVKVRGCLAKLADDSAQRSWSRISSMSAFWQGSQGILRKRYLLQSHWKRIFSFRQAFVWLITIDGKPAELQYGHRIPAVLR